MRKRDLLIELLHLITGFGKKAAPRFELGIKDLQSSALPLGHAADSISDKPIEHSINYGTKTLLVITNGHGEDLIAFQVLSSLRKLIPGVVFEIFPLVGEGKIFSKGISEGWLRMVGPTYCLPSGGFSNQSFRNLFNDLSAGLIRNFFVQLICVNQLAQNERVILAVGDLLPLFMAWFTGTSFAFIGTPKSDYTWKSGPGFAISDIYHCLKKSEWDPWEHQLMKSRNCRFVAVRDQLTSRGLRRCGVKALAPGNPMMDGFANKSLPNELEGRKRLLLLCGSRSPEAEKNFQALLNAIELLYDQYKFFILVPLGSEPDVRILEILLKTLGYKKNSYTLKKFGVLSAWEKKGNKVLLGPGQFFHWAKWAEVAIANAGTATEQIVGLGIPALSLPGNGPQFTKSFAFRQSRLLGGSVIVCKTRYSLSAHLVQILQDENSKKQLSEIGTRRMGGSGGSYKLAELVVESLLST